MEENARHGHPRRSPTQENKNLVAAMAKELEELEHYKNASIAASNREVPKRDL